MPCTAAACALRALVRARGGTYFCTPARSGCRRRLVVAGLHTCPSARGAALPLREMSNVGMREYTRVEVASLGASCDPCLIIIDGVVYDVTPYLREHPGGGEVLASYSGMDATSAFEEVGHSSSARQLLQFYKCGIIVAAKALATQ
ncbi:cytochrome b5 domain-containing protein [archaeon]|nr:MAG: cytochrome b5 domain-containing protein [archaeon]